MSETGDYYSLEELARDDNMTLDPAVCGNITDEYMLVICINTLFFVCLLVLSQPMMHMLNIYRWIYVGILYTPFVACFFVVQPNMNQENLTLKSAKCRDINDECMVVIEMLTKFCLRNSNPPLLIFSMLLRHPLCLFVCFVSHSQINIPTEIGW